MSHASEFGRQPLVLLVEDDPQDALIVEELLEDSGLSVRLEWARSVDEARRALVRLRPQCVLVDLGLPDAHEFSALSAVIEEAGDAAVVVLTGLAEEQAGLAAVTAGAQDYLVKGRVEAEWLGRTLRYAMQRKQAEQAAVALHAERMRAKENERLERGLLPTPLLQSMPIEVASRYRPSRGSATLGGDFFDVVESDDKGVHAVIGDVCGHGPDEAALGVCLRIAWRALVLSGVTGTTLLRRLERILEAERPGADIFVTMSTLVLESDQHTVRIWRAGHPGMLLHDGDTVSLAEPQPSLALGLPVEADWQEDVLELPAGGGLTLYTDGLFERRLPGAPPRWLGEEGLLELAQRHAHRDGEGFLDALIADVEEITAPDAPADDLAVVHLRWRERT
ncbi:PP2C family protein-serine/threonine phosphatase [Nonomuraea gerenzanensis]|uniref:Serine phosphatase RsbU, regulator of sigma subunit n=1 Tax=Nonomuraea gerenzanensis TaxID=93944 RepID=A0A1M4DZZ2_9ACTN|nr:fused response regulator/phosphatase [Nonomuraea gerenzanensis]UBU14416.1 fused response regulator/phosphatase [Nonomuraea gerenzanensis]SBO92130.1 Serine phosphatase RsbU, regulator of sigma subunit [Nonomuraea gerenzanensis]